MSDKQSVPKHIHEFSINAYRYDEHTALQQTIARELVAGITSKPRNVMDLGCGSGAVYRNITWELEAFVGVDSAQAMCERHPRSPLVRIVNADFDAPAFWDNLTSSYDAIISSSALQWSSDIEQLLRHISFTCKEGAFAIFTDKTFQSVYELSGLKTFLPHAKTLIQTCETYFTCKHEIKTFRLFFEDNLSLFRYIKKTGVSGGAKQLTFAQTKALIQNYPYDYLECEVLFIWGTPLNPSL